MLVAERMTRTQVRRVSTIRRFLLVAGLLAPLARAAEPPAEVAVERQRIIDDLREEHLAISQRRLTPVERSAAVLALRGPLLEEWIGLAGRSGDADDAAAALAVLADVEQADVRPVRDVPCAGAVPVGFEEAVTCLLAGARTGVVLVTRGAPTVFTTVEPRAGGVRLVSGTADEDGLHLEGAVDVRDPRLPRLVERMVDADARVHELDRWSDVDTEATGRLRRFDEGWITERTPPREGDLVLCEVADALVPDVTPPRVRALVTEEEYSHRLWTVQARELPCAEGYVLGAGTGIDSGTRRRYPLGEGEPAELHPPFVQVGDVRLRTRIFGRAVVTEHAPEGSGPPYGGECEFSHLGGVTRVPSARWCSITLAAELDSDGIADFIVHTGGEGCVYRTLWMSAPTGWVDVARDGECE